MTLFLTIVMVHDGEQVIEEYVFNNYDNKASCYADFNNAANYGMERAKELSGALGYRFEYLKLECNQ